MRHITTKEGTRFASIARCLFICILIEIVLITGYVKQSQGQTLGYDLLALQHKNFQGEKTLPFLTSNLALGTLDHTFGDSFTSINNLLDSGKFVSYRVYLVNGPCIANGNCGAYEPFPKDTLKTFEAKILKKDCNTLKYFRDRTSLYCPLKAKYPNINLLISPVLEHRLSTKAYRIVANEVLLACPGVQLVNNPVTGKGERYKGALLEAHATTVSADIYSWDGMDAADGDINKWLSRVSKSKIAFVWTRSYNCRAGGGSFVDPRARKNCPSEKTFELAAHLADTRLSPIKPSFTCSFSSFKAPSIWKPLSEDYHNGNDPRSNLPVAIAPLASSRATIRGMKGTDLGILSYFGVYQGNLKRYYSGTGAKLSGYEFEKKATSIDGSPYVYLKQGSKCMGPFIPGRRAGLMR